MWLIARSQKLIADVQVQVCPDAAHKPNSGSVTTQQAMLKERNARHQKIKTQYFKTAKAVKYLYKFLKTF
jgi:hypothetical protein